MAALNDLTIRFGGLTVPAQDHPLGLPPSYSMQAIKDQVPTASLTPNGFRDLFYPVEAVRLPTGILMEALSYIKMIVPGIPWPDFWAYYEDLEAKAWDNWSQITGIKR